MATPPRATPLHPTPAVTSPLLLHLAVPQITIHHPMTHRDSFGLESGYEQGTHRLAVMGCCDCFFIAIAFQNIMESTAQTMSKNLFSLWICTIFKNIFLSLWLHIFKLNNWIFNEKQCCNNNLSHHVTITLWFTLFSQIKMKGNLSSEAVSLGPCQLLGHQLILRYLVAILNQTEMC